MREMAYVNGRITPLSEAVVSAEDRGYQFADGVYEVVKFFGHYGVRLVPHLERLKQSAAHLRMPEGPSVGEWLGIINDLMDACEIPDDNTTDTILYQQHSRGVAPRNHLFPGESSGPVAVAYFRRAPRYTPQQRENGIALLSQEDERWNRCFIKSVCLLPAVLAKQAAADAGCFEALLVRNGLVTEGSATNSYCVRDGVVWTHPNGPHILGGITRQLVLEAAQAVGVTVREEAVTLEQFAAADEAFISSTTMNIMPATQLDKRPIGNGQVGPVTQKLSAALEAIICAESANIATLAAAVS